MNKQENKELHDLIEKESPKNIVVSFLLAMVFGVAAGLAAIAFREVFENVAISIIYSDKMLGILSASQPHGIKRLCQIVALSIMLLGWVISFMIVWHKIEKAPTMERRVKFGVIAIAVAVALFGAFELINYAVLGDWLRLNGAIL